MVFRGTDAYMTRGDTEEITIKLKESMGGADPVDKKFVSGDTVVMTVREKPAGDEELGSVKFASTGVIDTDTGVCTITITPSNTKALSFGAYLYDIQATFKDGRVKTLVPEANLVLGREVTVDG